MPVDGNYALRFESINHRARVFLDGKEVARHKGEYLPFDVRAFLKAGTRHSLVVRADWRGPTAMKRDGWHRLWFNFGGINRGVSIRRIGDSELCYPMMQTRLVGGAALVDLRVHVHNNGEPRALGVRGTPDARRSQDRARLPRRADRQGGHRGARDVGEDRRSRSCGRRRRRTSGSSRSRSPARRRTAPASGLRDVRTRGADLLLNGTAIKLRGASIHEDVFGRGDGLRPVDQDRIVAQLKAIDANATRSQHPLDQGLLERLDAAGIMIWQGIGPTDAPGAWTSRGEERVKVAKNRVRTTFRQAQLHPSIITWNLANEVAGNGHPEGQIPYVDSMAEELKRARSRPADRAGHLGRAPAEADVDDLRERRHDRLDELHRLVRGHARPGRGAARADPRAPGAAARRLPRQGHRGDGVRRRGQRAQRRRRRRAATPSSRTCSTCTSRRTRRSPTSPARSSGTCATSPSRRPSTAGRSRARCPTSSSCAA